MPELNSKVTKVLNKSTPGIQIWRIESMEMVPVPEKSYGNFFEGDCYVLLMTHKTSGGFTYDLHYWIGKESSQDEQGAAAIFTMQMDEHLGGVAVQHREAQGYESEIFKGYFKHGLIYKQGGVASGMKHVETNTYNVQRLLHVKGKKNVVAGEVEMKWSNFNSGDVFLLDLGKLIVQWNGPESNRMERIKGMNLAKDIRDRERGGRAQIGVVDGEDEGASDELMSILTRVLGEKKDIKPAISDEVVEKVVKTGLKLYHVSDANGNLVVQEVAVQPLTQDLLKHEDCYILDQGGQKIYVWKGKNSTKDERQQAMNRALNFIKAKNYSPSTYVETENDGAESAMFKQLFQRWTVKNQTVGLGKTHSVGKVAKVEQVKFDAATMHAKPEMAAQQKMVDDGSGNVEVWRVENLELVPVDKRWLGHFYGGDCYLILYQYQVNNKIHYILYIWQGRHASQDEIAASAYHAVAVDQKYDGQPVQVRVPMGKEPAHLMAIFKGKMVVYEGGTSRESESDSPPPAIRLFQVHGSNEYNTKAFEVPVRASSLNSNDVFILKTTGSTYLWCGKGCSGDEREMAKYVTDFISRGEKVVIAEGQEPNEFWMALGGKSQYANNKK
ncbi:villin-1-like [Rhinatrema bivittatum]|uniref:villin-1-like n=1 Tax=Rhinatrema bivittatum TaxID=194408 RepID=UPI00112E4E4A|nr:villin-1-like [Rhinatrema bivittatum]